jgi:hypothetical protein
LWSKGDENRNGETAPVVSTALAADYRAGQKRTASTASMAALAQREGLQPRRRRMVKEGLQNNDGRPTEAANEKKKKKLVRIGGVYHMTKEELATALNGGEYRDEITLGLREQAEKSGLVVVYGYSSDVWKFDAMKFDGAIHDEINCDDDRKVYLSESGPWKIRSGCKDCPHAARERAKCKTIRALWHDEGNPCWTYETEIPHAKFNIYKGGNLYCVGIVFEMAALKDMRVVDGLTPLTISNLWEDPEGRDESYDKPLPEDAQIKAVFPTKTGDHDLYMEALRLVNAKRSKYGLVDLVNWLLWRLKQCKETPALRRWEHNCEPPNGLYLAYSGVLLEPKLVRVLAGDANPKITKTYYAYFWKHLPKDSFLYGPIPESKKEQP